MTVVWKPYGSKIVLREWARYVRPEGKINRCFISLKNWCSNNFKHQQCFTRNNSNFIFQTSFDGRLQEKEGCVWGKVENNLVQKYCIQIGDLNKWPSYINFCRPSWGSLLPHQSIYKVDTAAYNNREETATPRDQAGQGLKCDKGRGGWKVYVKPGTFIWSGSDWNRKG